MTRVADVTVLLFFPIFFDLPGFSDMDSIQFADLLLDKPEKRSRPDGSRRDPGRALAVLLPEKVENDLRRRYAD